MTDHRSAITGQYVTAEYAKTNPDTTVSESPCAECGRLRGVVRTQRVALDGYREEVERLRAEPIVRTVGDLTARHIGRRARIGKTPPATLMGLSWREVGVRVHLFTPDAEAAWQNLPLNTPCEVLP